MADPVEDILMLRERIISQRLRADAGLLFPREERFEQHANDLVRR